MTLNDAAQPDGQAARDDDDDAAEEAAGKPPDNTAERHSKPVDTVAQHFRADAEIGIVADQRERSESGRNHAADNEAARAALEGAAHFLDAEDDARERRVEGSGDAGRCSDQDEPGLAPRRHAPDREHDRGANLYGRPFATGRRAAGKAE